MYSSTPPVPPPKPNSHETSRISTPTASNSPRPPPLSQEGRDHSSDLQTVTHPHAQQEQVADPGDSWLPRYLEDKSKQDLQTLLTTPALLSALTHSPTTSHPSLSASTSTLDGALASNIDLATHLVDLEQRLAALRASTSAQLLSARQLERAWRAKQGEMDAALAPFAPASLYQRLAAGVAEQEAVCRALEESFLDGDGGGVEGERDAADWVRRYRDQKRMWYLRRERKERWDEGRVGGWR